MSEDKITNYFGEFCANDSFKISIIISNEIAVGKIPLGLAPPFKTEFVALS